MEGGRRHSCPSSGESICCHDGIEKYGGGLLIRGTRYMWSSKKKLMCKTGSRVIYGSLSDDDADFESTVYVRSLQSTAVEKVGICHQRNKAAQLMEELREKGNAGSSGSESDGWDYYAPQQGAETLQMKIADNKAINVEGGRRHSCPSSGESICCHDGIEKYGGGLLIRGTRYMWSSKKKLMCKTGSRVIYGSLSDDDADFESTVYVRSLQSTAVEKVGICHQRNKAAQLMEELREKGNAGSSGSESDGWDYYAPQQGAETLQMKIADNKRNEKDIYDGKVQQEEEEDEFARSKLNVQAKVVLPVSNTAKKEPIDGSFAWQCLNAKMQIYQKYHPSLIECSLLDDPMLCEDFGKALHDVAMGISTSKTGSEIVCFQFLELCRATKYFNIGNWVRPSKPLLFIGLHPIHGKIAVRLFLRSDSSEVEIYEQTLNVLAQMSSFLGTCSEDSDFLCLIYKFENQNSFSMLLKSEAEAMGLVSKMAKSEAEAMRLVSELVKTTNAMLLPTDNANAQEFKMDQQMMQSQSQVARRHPHIEEVEESAGESGPTATTP
ncbi:unnamed protein product [Urochloa humidicola]